MTTPPVLTSVDDPDAVAVFADALEAAGDPRGVLTHLQLAREARPQDARLAHAEARHLALHGKVLLGALATASSMTTLEWRRGFVRALALHSQAEDVPQWRRERPLPPPRSRLPRLVRELAHLPVMSRLEALTLSMPASGFCALHLGEAFDAALRLQLPLLATLRVHVLVPDDDFDPVLRETRFFVRHQALQLDVDAVLRAQLERHGVIAPLPRLSQREAALEALGLIEHRW
ncbi:MAG: hypothetical protein JNJ54_37090 [Myxococcaceae bacterium]|nr:hypothetical protein [Myxococcaceae bacterium]